MKQSKINQNRQIVEQTNAENKSVEIRTTENYKIAVDLVIFEGEMLWQIMSAFLLVNTILVTFMASIAFKDQNSWYPQFSFPCFITGALGLAIIFPWYGTFVRNTAFYNLRIEQAKALEQTNLKLLKETGEYFAKGYQVYINGKPQKINWAGRNMKNKLAGYWLIGTFLTVYAMLFIIYGPWMQWFCK